MSVIKPELIVTYVACLWVVLFAWFMGFYNWLVRKLIVKICTLGLSLSCFPKQCSNDFLATANKRIELANVCVFLALVGGIKHG